MKVADAIKKDVLKVARSTSLKKLLELFKDFHALPLIPVVEDEHLIGVVYLDHLLDLLKPQEVKMLKNIPFVEVDEDIFDLEPVPAMGDLILVDDIMDAKFICLEDDVSLEDAYKIMCTNNRDQLPVVDKNKKLLGIIGVFDIVRRIFMQKGIL